jgi:hypothetical protein
LQREIEHLLLLPQFRELAVQCFRVLLRLLGQFLRF